MFELFSDQPVYDYPTLINVGYSLVWAILLSSAIAITHKVTHTGPNYPKHLFQTIALGSIVAAMVMMAIGDSLARGLGAFGALAMIRFRTRIQDPKNIRMAKKDIRSQVRSVIGEQTKGFHEKSTILREERVECNYDIVLPFPNDHYFLLESLQSIDGVERVSINYNQNMEEI